MKTHFTKHKIFLLLIGFLFINSSNAQVVEYLDANNVKAGFGIGGNLFSEKQDSPVHTFLDTVTKYSLLEVPKGSNRHPVFTAALWMNGFDSTFGILHCAAQHYPNGSRDFYNGPIASVYDSVYDTYYHRVFKVTKTQIEHFKTFTPPVPVSQIDSEIWRWPAKGNPFVAANYNVNINAHLAPFVDVNGDGYYSPEQGDYPAICGDEAIFFVLNDVRGPHNATQTQNKLGFEVRGLAEVFADNNTSSPYAFEKRAVNNTVFVNYEIENKSQYAYRDFRLALWEDPDLGCFSNDRVGCDTNRNLMSVYNDGNDPDCNGVKGYAPYKVSHGVKYLNNPMTTFGYFVNGAPIEMTSPSNCMEHNYYMQALWKDGTPFTDSLTGYGVGDSTHFIFPGNPNNSSDWSDQTSSQPAGDRRMFGSSGPMNFALGETKHFDFAFITPYDSTAGNLTIVDTLRRDADIVQQFYNNQIAPCKAQFALGINDIPVSESSSLLVYPNPAASELNIAINGSQPESVCIYSTDGKKVIEVNHHNNTTIDVSALARGVYIAEAKTNNTIQRIRWVKL